MGYKKKYEKVIKLLELYVKSIENNYVREDDSLHDVFWWDYFPDTKLRHFVYLDLLSKVKLIKENKYNF